MNVSAFLLAQGRAGSGLISVEAAMVAMHFVDLAIVHRFQAQLEGTTWYEFAEGGIKYPHLLSIGGDIILAQGGRSR